MGKSFCLVVALFSVLTLRAQDTTVVREALDRLESSLIAKDTAAVSQLLHKDLRFGHSNGWVQTKRDAIDDLKNGSLVYEQFNRQSLRIEMMNKSAIVREWLEVKGKRNGNEFNVKLFVLQQWIKTKKGWQLLVRQGAKQG